MHNAWARSSERLTVRIFRCNPSNKEHLFVKQQVLILFK